MLVIEQSEMEQLPGPEQKRLRSAPKPMSATATRAWQGAQKDFAAVERSRKNADREIHSRRRLTAGQLQAKFVAEMVKVARQAAIPNTPGIWKQQAHVTRKSTALFLEMKADLFASRGLSTDSGSDREEGDEEEADEAEEEDAVGQPASSSEVAERHPCADCGRGFKTLAGLLSHKKACQKPQIKSLQIESSGSDSESPDEADYKTLSTRRLRELAETGELASREVEVWWTVESAWFRGTVTRVRLGSRAHAEKSISIEVKYDDGERRKLLEADQEMRLVRRAGRDPGSSSDDSDSSEDENQGGGLYANKVTRVGPEYQCKIPDGRARSGPGRLEVDSAQTLAARVGTVVFDPRRVKPKPLAAYMAALKRPSDPADQGAPGLAAEDAYRRSLLMDCAGLFRGNRAAVVAGSSIDEPEFVAEPWPMELGPKPEVSDTDPCASIHGVARGKVPLGAPDIVSEPVKAVPLDVGLAHLHACGYDVSKAKKQLGLEGLAAAKAPQVGPDKRTLRFQDAIRMHGKDFAKACTVLNAQRVKGRQSDPVSVADLTVFYYSEFKHSSAYRQWKRSTQYLRSKEACAQLRGLGPPDRTGLLAASPRKQPRASHSRSSRYCGVSWSSAKSCWRAVVRVKGHTVTLGGFAAERAAAAAYDKAAFKHHGASAHLNFRNEDERLLLSTNTHQQD